MKTSKTINHRTRLLHSGLLSLVFIFSSCLGEVKEKIETTTEGMKNASTVVKNAKKVQEDAQRLQEMDPLTNDQLKEWLPETLEDLKRTGFKVGTAGYMNIASVEGTYKWENDSDSEEKDKKFIVSIMDGAGSPAAGMMMAGYNLASKMDMEEEDEYKHTKTLEKNGVKAHQTFHKIRNETVLRFVYGERFGVNVNGVKMDPEEAWDYVEELDLKELLDMTE